MSEFGYLFEEKELNSTEKIKGRSFATKLKHEQKLVNRFDSLKEVLPKIEKDKSIHLISSDNFGSIELLKLLCELSPLELNITTWSLNQDFIDFIKSIKCTVNLYFDKSLKTRKNHLYAQLAELAIDNKINLKVHHMLHAKITCIKTKDFYISIEASANYSNNQRIENFTITENKELFIFHKKWMEEIIKK